MAISTPVTAYLFIDNRLGGSSDATPPDLSAMPWVTANGWAPVQTGTNRASNPAIPDEIGIDEGDDSTIEQRFSVYSQVFSSGSFQVEDANNGGRNMYGLAIQPLAVTATE